MFIGLGGLFVWDIINHSLEALLLERLVFI